MGNMAKYNRILSRTFFRVKESIRSFHGKGKLLENAKKPLYSNGIELGLVKLRKCYGQIFTYIERFQDKKQSIKKG